MLAQHQGCLGRMGRRALKSPMMIRGVGVLSDTSQRLSLHRPGSRVRDFQVSDEYGYNRPTHIQLCFQSRSRLRARLGLGS